MYLHCYQRWWMLFTVSKCTYDIIKHLHYHKTSGFSDSIYPLPLNPKQKDATQIFNFIYVISFKKCSFESHTHSGKFDSYTRSLCLWTFHNNTLYWLEQTAWLLLTAMGLWTGICLHGHKDPIHETVTPGSNKWF